MRLSLNISDARDTSTNRFVSTYFGAGVHHIAFAAADAGQRGRAAACRGRAACWKSRPTTTRTSRPGSAWTTAETAELEQPGLLFDSDAEGEFRQAYTLSFQQRFYFEAVERRGSYAGFGAANAPVRMAAQARVLMARGSPEGNPL